MDHGYRADHPLQPLAPELVPASTRIASFLANGGRAVVVSGPRGCGKTAIIDRLLTGQAGRVTRVQNPLAGPFALSGILHQMGEPAEGDGDERGQFFRTVAAQAYDDDSAVLAVDDAHTLTSFALSTLARVPGLGGPDLPGMILVLAGEPPLLEKLSAPGLDLLRNSRRTLILELPSPAAPAIAEIAARAALSEPASPLIEIPLLPLSGRRHVGLGTRALLLSGAVGALLMLAVVGWLVAPSVLLSDPAPATTAPASPEAETTIEPEAAPPPKAADERAPAAAVPALVPPADASPGDMAVAGSLSAADLALRREFDAFLNRAGQDTVKLTPAARQVLYLEYLQWQARKASDRSVLTIP